MSKWIPSLSVLVITGLAGVTFVEKIDGRIEQLESTQSTEPRYVARVTKQLAKLREDLIESRGKLRNLEAEGRKRSQLEEQVAELECQLEVAQRNLAAQSVEIAGVGQRQDEILKESIGEGLQDLHQNLEARWNDVSQTLEATAQIAEKNRHTFDDFVRELPTKATTSRNVENMWNSLLGPTIQIADESTVGSGVLLKSESLASGGHRTHVLTAYHVIRDILDDPADTEQDIPVYLYKNDGKRRALSASILATNPGLDIALLELNSKEAFNYGAILPIRGDLAKRSVFDSIYAVGCPLGNDPIPTFGEIADTHHEVDGDAYWMISAPTYIGNSGGGVFDAQSFELLGIFSKIYTHGNLRPTVVPHMGLVTPMATVYDWLEEVGYESLIPE